MNPATTTSGAASQTRVVVFSGPKEGVGKTTLALNMALAWAGIQKRNVLVVPFDALPRFEHAQYFGINPPTVIDLIKSVGEQSLTVAGSLLKGRIPISNWGVGVLPLANKRSDLERLSASTVLPILSKLSSHFDIFIDVDSSFPLQAVAYDIADVVFWVTHSTRSHLSATVGMFAEYKELHFPLDRFEIVNNCYNVPGSIEVEEMEKFFQQLQKKVLVYLPWEDSIPALGNQLKFEVVEDAQSNWVKGLRILLGRVMSIEPVEKKWASAVSDEEFARLAGAMWTAKPGGGGGGGASSGAAAAGPEINHEKSGDNLPPFWESLKQRIHKDVVKAMEMERVHVSDEVSANQDVRKKVAGIADDVLQKQQGVQLTRDQRVRFINELLDEILGLGPIEELMRDSTVSEIMVNAPEKVFIERRGKLVLTKYRFRDNDHVVQVMKRIVAPLGRRIDESVPYVDARLKDGSRVNAIIAPLAVSGPTLTIRRFSQKPLGPEDYFRFGSISRDSMDFLQACVHMRKDIIISGGTGTGKTTFLNALSSYIPNDERIISVEDTAELRLQQPHWVSLESRPPNIEGKGEVTIRDLVKNCLRMRPDRIVIGECRGSEALDMLQAMNTGHEGSLTTVHANTPRDALTRLEAMCLMAGAALPIWALREMITSAVHLIVQLSRFSDGTRKVTYVTEITGREDTQILTHDIYRYHQTGVSKEGKVEGYFTATGEPPKFYPEFAAKGINMPIETFWTNEQKKARQAAPGKK